MQLEACTVAVLLALGPARAAAELRVTVRDGRVDLVATAAPLSEVLGQLARQTHFDLVLDGPAPSRTLTLRLSNRRPTEAVLEVLDGLGVGYALAMDSTATRLETLILLSGSGATRAAPGPVDLEVPTPATAPEYPVVPEPADFPVSEPAPTPPVGSEPPPLAQVHSPTIHPSTFTPAAELVESLRGVNLTAAPAPAAAVTPPQPSR